MPEAFITFLDVGQGDGTVISSPVGELVLIDLGSKKNAKVAGTDAITATTAIVKKSMEDRGARAPTLDHLLLTHGDSDHTNLLPGFLAFVKTDLGKPLDILEVAIGGDWYDYDPRIRADVLSPAQEVGRLVAFQDTAYDEIQPDDTVKPRWTLGGGVKMYLLSANYPTVGDDNTNSKSLVVMVEYGGRKVILTGDAEFATEKEIIRHYAAIPGFLNSFGLKLGHHGSANATSEAWLQEVRQQASFASSDMRWAHPYCETTTRVEQTIGSGSALFAHDWLCGQGSGASKDYTNHLDSDAGFYTTMASITETAQQDPTTGATIEPGLVQGVQYQLSMYSNGKLQLYDTLGHDSGVFTPSQAAGVPPPERSFVPPPVETIPPPHVTRPGG